MEALIKKLDGKFPYEYLSNQLLINGDCLKVMELIDDKSVDLVLTDPPYGIGVDGGIGGGVLAKKSSFEKKNWDNESPKKEVFDKIIQIGKNQIIFGANHFIQKIPFNSSCWLVWDKNNGTNNFADCELAYTSFKTAVRKYTWKWQGMLQQDMKDKDIKIHPTQKPVGLFCLILNNYSEPNDLVLDAFSGSGTTAVACYKTERRSICIELDPDYFKASVERLKEELRQGDMFRND